MTLSLQDFADVVTVLRDPMDKNAAAEKRRATRMSVSAKVTAHLLDKGHIGRSFSVLARDVSLTGIGVLQAVSVQQGQEILLSLARPHGHPLMVVAKAMHCRPLADGLLAVGLEFSHVFPDPAAKSQKQPQQASTPAVAGR